MSLDTAITTNIIATTLMVLTYTYLFIQYKQSYLAKWVMVWVLQEIRLVFLDKPFGEQLIVPSFLYIGLSFANSLLMIAGTVGFAGKRLSPKWLVTALVFSTLSFLGIFGGLAPSLYMLPGVAFVGSAYIYTGFVIWNSCAPGMGKWLTASAFVLLGVHAFDMPFLFSLAWFAPWGYLIDGLLRYAIAIGIILVYFEKTKNELEQYYQLLARNTTDVIYRYNFNSPAGFDYISPAVTHLTGYTPDYFRTLRQVMRIIHPDDRAKLKKIATVGSLPDGFVTLRVRARNGDIVWAEQKNSLVVDSTGRPIAAEGIVRDITKRILLEEDVSRLDRLNIVGQMAANFAHEVRNPLTTVRGYLQLLGKKSEFSNYKEQFGLLLEELDRTNHIITEYLSLSKNKIVEMKKCNLNHILLALHPLVQATAVSTQVTVDLNLGAIPELYIDDKEIKQLILNLTRNAIEAMTSGGKLEIKTLVSGNSTILIVTDQGKGIPSHVMDNLGKPFLTTKENGTGLGMAICYRICLRHNAKLDINTGPAGTTINVIFPNS
ncbi:Adaptive-response sensory-kinase SasA [Sporomusa silvacetica DSM 10669]|uniref:histidine kinase n=1 Tax=Sporomusa silvacetica DSM 10669 TaxID=1123289 RepID=A0ABZ3ISI3_9FIRM|nr:PAS domain-containing sensor histidine kinase [Sporomusa silvacetica]OZC19440.1 sporulation kinase A [Sporomusa silvacetica DSM 10669]